MIIEKRKDDGQKSHEIAYLLFRLPANNATEDVMCL
jgi:hypothetical protein